MLSVEEKILVDSGVDSTLSSMYRIVKLWLEGKSDDSLDEVSRLLGRQEVRKVIDDTTEECTEWIIGRARASDAIHKPKRAVKKILAVKSKYPILSFVRRLVRLICQEKGCDFAFERGVNFTATKVVHLTVSKNAMTLTARVVSTDEIRGVLLEGKEKWGLGDEVYMDFAFKVALFVSILCYYIVEVDHSVWDQITKEAMKSAVNRLRIELSRDEIDEVLDLLGLD